jgi:tetratricopeptide (TPR) repeat protein
MHCRRVFCTPSRRRKISAALLALFMLLTPFLTAGAQLGTDYQYTYTYDYWGSLRQSPDAYRVAAVLYSAELGLATPVSNPSGLFVKGNFIYLCDTGNNRILQIRRGETGFFLERIIDGFTGGGSPNRFASPSDVFVTREDELFICDTENQRVLKLDRDLRHILTITKPADETFDQNIAFLPMRVVADTTGRAFVLVRNVNKGLAKFENDGRFTGFIGAMPVSFSLADQVWRLLSTRRQREQQASFVPTEFDNVYMDAKGFIYSVTTTFSEYDLLWDKARPIRKLNAVGTDILVKNGEYPPVGDLDWGTAAGYSGPSKFSDITALDNGVYVALDKTRGRLFGYDEQGRSLWIFGGAGNMAGFFRNAVSIDHIGYDLLVLDSLENSVTLFEPTEYGRLIYLATEQYQRGEYSQSAQNWSTVLRRNGNFDLAYIGIGRALLRGGQYEQAMRYFKLANDEDNYSKAYQEYRKLWVEENIAWMFAALLLLFCVPLVIGRVRRIRKELAEG